MYMNPSSAEQYPGRNIDLPTTKDPGFKQLMWFELGFNTQPKE
jgi:hypothetical protein